MGHGASRWQHLLLHDVTFMLAVGLTILSLKYVRPTDCQHLCSTDPCPTGYCRTGEQRAGFPFPILLDNNDGGSPIAGWGKLGPEDYPLPYTFVLDVLFYGMILWLIWAALTHLTLHVYRYQKKASG